MRTQTDLTMSTIAQKLSGLQAQLQGLPRLSDEEERNQARQFTKRFTQEVVADLHLLNAILSANDGSYQEQVNGDLKKQLWELGYTAGRLYGLQFPGLSSAEQRCLARQQVGHLLAEQFRPYAWAYVVSWSMSYCEVTMRPLQEFSAEIAQGIQRAIGEAGSWAAIAAVAWAPHRIEQSFPDVYDRPEQIWDVELDAVPVLPCGILHYAVVKLIQGNFVVDLDPRFADYYEELKVGTR